MKHTDKELLLRDLSARLPYDVQILVDSDKEFDGGVIGRLVGIVPYTGKKYDIQGPLFYQDGCLTPSTIKEVRPYLRPLSSMTEEELEELNCLYYHNISIQDNRICGYICRGELEDVIDWLNKKHFDYRGLIPKELALEALEDMYV